MRVCRGCNPPHSGLTWAARSECVSFSAPLSQFPKSGVVVVICAAILGQMVGSYLADTFGWFGVAKVPFNPVRLGGLGLMVIGVLLVQRK